MRKLAATFMLVLAAAVCSAEDPPEEPRPVMVRSHRINPLTGKVLGTVEGANTYDWASPARDEPGQFVLRNHRDPNWTLRVDTATGKGTKVHTYATVKDRQINAYDAAGNEQWVSTLPRRVNNYRGPHLLRNDDTFFVAYIGGVSAFDAKTGDLRWDSEGLSDRLCLLDGLLLATDCSNLSKKDVRLLTARKLEDGTEAWRVELPHELEIQKIVAIGDHALVCSDEVTNNPWSWFLDEEGNATLKLHENVHQALCIDDDWLIVSNKRIALLHPDGKAVWVVKNDGDDVYDSGECHMTAAEETLYLHSWGGDRTAARS
ncbi:MAG: PQQ-binding-like beta-propeller repeat protein [Planctomycetota bacterium]